MADWLKRSRGPGYVGCTRSLLNRAVARGELPAAVRRPGENGWWWPVEDLDRFKDLFTQRKALALPAAVRQKARMVQAALGVPDGLTLAEGQRLVRAALYEGLKSAPVLRTLFAAVEHEDPRVALQAVEIILNKTVASLTHVEQQRLPDEGEAQRQERVAKALEVIAANKGKVVEVQNFRVLADE